MVPDWLYFRRDHPERTTPYTVHTRCAYLDPRRADRLRNPAVRLYAEYLWGYVTAIMNAPLSPADRRECYGYLARWLASRVMPVAGRSLRGGALHGSDATLVPQAVISVSALVAGQERKGL
jgi:hypothetical protein